MVCSKEKKLRLLIWDLDGVILDAKPIHHAALNKAISEYKLVPDCSHLYTISEQEHLEKYDGLPTKEKLKRLTKEKGLPTFTYEQICIDKQKYTIELIRKRFKRRDDLVFLFEQLQRQGFTLYCASNSIRNTIITALAQLGILEYFSYIFSNEDVKNSKPHPEIYLKCFIQAGVSPKEALIFEDSAVGQQAALASGGNLCRVESPESITYNFVMEAIKNVNSSEKTKWKPSKKVNVLIPMAGAGSRFAEAGYIWPKPLISVKGKPMIQVVTENLNIDAQFIYITQKEHCEKYAIELMLNIISPTCKTVIIDKLTEGAACTTLLAKQFINNDDPLIIANSDQFLEWDSNAFYYSVFENKNIDGSIVVFNATHPKWSFVKVDENGYVTEVAEKKPISNIATTGVYLWKKGSDYVKYAEQMIQKNIRVNNEFYVCPVFQQAIDDGKKFTVFYVKSMNGTGTPEDLNNFLKTDIKV
jgi:HAD superfamily hydrolase (TIGR01509 family)